ncbi:hypothetical protein T484DRAFT_1880539, partial [Baffinella frigidus]
PTYTHADPEDRERRHWETEQPGDLPRREGACFAGGRHQLQQTPLECRPLARQAGRHQAAHVRANPLREIGDLGGGGLRGQGPLGPLGSSSTHHRRTLELVLQGGPASVGIASSPPVLRIAAETGQRPWRTTVEEQERPRGGGRSVAKGAGAASLGACVC